MTVVSIHVAKSTLSRLIARVEAGEEVAIARGGRPVAKLVPILAETKGRKFGAYAGSITIGPEFFEPLPERELAAWE